MCNNVRKNIKILMVFIAVLANGSASLATTIDIGGLPWSGPSTPVSTTVDGVQCLDFSCNFTLSTSFPSNVWSKSINLDLSDANYDICFRTKVSNPAMVGSYGIDFGNASGGEIAYRLVPLATDQWQTIRIPKSVFYEGSGTWSNLRTLYLMIVGAMNGSTHVYIENITAQSTTSPNLLSNSGFEFCSSGTVPDFWGAGNFGLVSDTFTKDISAWNSQWGVDSTVSHSGTKSLRIDISDPNSLDMQVVSNWVPLEVGSTYTLSAWMKSSRIGTMPVTMKLEGVASKQVSVPTSWHRFTFSNITIPTTTPSTPFNKTRCFFNSGATGKLWIDDVQIEKSTAATNYAPADSDAAIPASLDYLVHRTAPSVSDTVIKPGPITSTSSIDANQRLLVDGIPFIPYALGWNRMPSLEVMQAIARAGFNTLTDWPAADSTLADIRAGLDHANACGLKVILNFNNITMSATDVQNLVTNLKDHPAVIAWYVYDEPTTADHYANALAFYNAAKLADPSRPAFINYIGGSAFPPSGGVVGDIACLDYYQEAPAASGRDAYRLCAGGKLSWLWLQGAGNDYMQPREPTGPEEECMVYSALIHGVRGIHYFVSVPHSLELWGEMRELAQEVRTLTPVLYSLETPPAVSTTTVGIDVLGKTYNSQPYIIAVNASPLSVPATVNIPPGYVSANVLFENRYVSVVNGQIQDSFGGYQRHVYRLLTQPSGGLNVNVTLGDYNADLSLLPIRVDLLQNDSVAYTTTATPAGNPTTITFSDIPAGNYSVRVKASKFLTSVSAANVTSGTYTTQNISLVSGDVDGDNEVTSTDLSSMLKNLGKSNQ